MIHRRHFLGTAAGALAAPFVSRLAHARNSRLKLHHLLGPKAPAHTKMLEPWANG